MTLKEAQNKLAGGPLNQLVRVLGDAQAIIDRAVQAEDELASLDLRLTKARRFAETEEARAATAKTDADAVAALAEEARSLKADNARLKADNALLASDNDTLRGEGAELEARKATLTADIQKLVGAQSALTR